MTYVLYGDPGSGSATVELTLAEIGAAVETRDVPLEKAAQRRARYRDLNPQRKLPTLLTPDGETMTESAAILLTLAERYPDAGLLPADPAVRAQALRWLVFLAAELYPVIEAIDYPERFQPEGERTSASRRDALKTHLRGIWRRRWTLVETAAADRGNFLPSGFSLVDIYVAVLSRWGQIGGWRERKLPRIEAIARAVAKRERLAATWQRHFPD